MTPLRRALLPRMAAILIVCRALCLLVIKHQGLMAIGDRSFNRLSEATDLYTHHFYYTSIGTASQASEACGLVAVLRKCHFSASSGPGSCYLERPF
jgi:hypothetical protein